MKRMESYLMKWPVQYWISYFLEELDRMESQILFSVSILSADDHVRLARIKEERAELKAKLEELNEKKDK